MLLLALSAVGISAVMAVGLRRVRVASSVPPLSLDDGDSIVVGHRLCGESIPGRLKIVNPSDRTLILREIHRFCGCVSVDAGPLPRSLEPGALLPVAFKLDARDIEGPLEQPIDFVCEGFDKPFRAWIKGQAHFPLPPSIELGAFGAPFQTDVKLRELAVSHGCEIIAARSLDEDLIVHVEPKALRLAVPPGAAGRRIDTAVDVTYRGAPITTQRVVVHGSASGGLLARPDVLVFGRMEVGGAPVTREVVVEDAGRRPFEIRAATCDQNVFAVEQAQTTPNSAVIKVTARPTRAMGIDQTVMIQTADPRRRVAVRCVGLAE
jgi:hypothetical protein